MSRRVWTDQEGEQVLCLAGKEKAQDIARQINRSARAVYSYIHRMGLSSRVKPPYRKPHPLSDFMYCLYSLGLPDVRVGERLGMSPRSVRRWRYGRGFAKNPMTHETRCLHSKSCKRTARRSGFKSIPEMIRHQQALASCRRGWKLPLDPAALRVAEIFFRRGPLRLDEACDRPVWGNRVNQHFQKTCRLLAHLGVLILLRRVGKMPVYAISPTARKDGRTCSDPARQV